MSENGIDTSNNNPGVPDGTISADFIWFKATEGVGYTDSDCNPSYQEALAAGKQVGVYHFARFDGNSPEDEAIWFASQIQGYLGTATLMLDYEVDPITPDLAKRFLDKLYELTKVRAMLYMSESRYDSQDWSAVEVDYAAWPAAYGANNPQHGYGTAQAPVSINGNWTIAGWQYTSNGYLPGYASRLDLDYFYGDRTAWTKYAIGDRNVVAPTPSPVVTPPPIVVPAPTPVPPVVTPPVEPPVITPPVVTPPVVEPPVVVTPPVVEPPIVVPSVPVVKKPSFNLFTFIANFFRWLFKTN